MSRPNLLLLDVNETLSDLAGLDPLLDALGAPGSRQRWFATVLRDGFARSMAGSPAPFAEVATAVARDLLGSDEAADRLIGAFLDLDVHPDVAPGLDALSGAGIRLVTLTNGATRVPDALLTRAGVRDRVERLLSVEDAPAWKPDPRSYAWALAELGVEAGEAMLVACHPWDVDGAARAGLRTAYVDRSGAPYPSSFTAPEVTVTGLDALLPALDGPTG